MEKPISRRALQNAASYIDDAAEDLRTASNLVGRSDALLELAGKLEIIALEMRAESYQSCG
jgi:hypothetical protein